MDIKNKLKAVKEMHKGISIVWYAPPERWDDYVRICNKYNYDWRAEDFVFKEEIKKFGRFVNELKKNNIIVMNVN